MEHNSVALPELCTIKTNTESDSWASCNKQVLLLGLSGEKGRLKPDAVPFVFVFRHPDPPTPRSAQKRRHIMAETSSALTVAYPMDVGCEVEVANTDDVSQTADDKKLSLSTSCTASIGCQCDLLKAKSSRLSVFKFKDNPSAIQYLFWIWQLWPLHDVFSSFRFCCASVVIQMFHVRAARWAISNINKTKAGQRQLWTRLVFLDSKYSI